MTDDGHKLKQERFKLDLTENIFTSQAIELVAQRACEVYTLAGFQNPMG